MMNKKGRPELRIFLRKSFWKKERQIFLILELIDFLAEIKFVDFLNNIFCYQPIHKQCSKHKVFSESFAFSRFVFSLILRFLTYILWKFEMSRF